MSKNHHLGYCEKLYIESLAEFGTPLELPNSRGWLLKRRIPGTSLYDAMGAYPLFACKDWTKLPLDMELLKDELVSVSLVTDPFGNHTTDILTTCFPDKMIPFKEHFIVDLSGEPDSISSHHRRNAQKALSSLDIEICTIHESCLDEWVRLYDNLIVRHGIKGISAFSRASFEKQLQLPGLTAIKAHLDGDTLGIILWFLQHDVAYYHLGAYDMRGYEMKASFALFSTALEYFRKQGSRYLSLGAGAGLDAKAEDGLTRFKRGWSSGTRTAYLCGKIFDKSAYERITASMGLGKGGYFPAYRIGEFG